MGRRSAVWPPPKRPISKRKPSTRPAAFPTGRFREAFLTYTQAQIDLAQAGLDLKLRTLLLLAYTGYYQNL